MQTLVHRLNESQSNLRSEGGAFFLRTREAGQGLVGATRTAGSLFLGETRQATRAFFTETRLAGQGFAGCLDEERRTWFGFVGSDLPTFPEVELRLFVTPDAFQARVLKPLKSALETARVRWLKAEPTSEEVAEAKPTKKAARKPSAKRFPVGGYDALNAKDAIAALSSLTAAQLRTVIAYEEAHKGRVTVLRAARGRLAN